MNNDQPKQLNYVVIGFWVLILLAVVFSLFDADKIKNVELYVQFAAALASAAAVFFAYQAVKVSNDALTQTREDRKQELSFKRPYLSFLSGEMGSANSDEGIQNFVHARFKNVGVNPAAELEAKFFLIDFEMDAHDLFDTSVANDIPAGFEFETNRGGLYISSPPSQEENFFIPIRIDYDDAILGDHYTQWFYLKWVYHDGIGGTSLYPPLKWEREQIKRIMRIGKDEKIETKHIAEGSP